jgi:NADH-quinone oxidoreductase subunit J
MAVTAAFFYVFATLAVVSAALVITAKNPVHAVLFLILTFFNAAGLFILLGAEFLAMLLIIVYVGAVAVLFLFVVMMLDVDFAELRAGYIKNAPVGLLVGGVVLAELVALYTASTLPLGLSKTTAAAIPTDVTNTEALGLLLYTKYAYFFQASGLILLTSMIGAIVLTLRHRVGVKRQSISAQNARGPATALDVIKVPVGGTGMPPIAAKAPEAAE